LSSSSSPPPPPPLPLPPPPFHSVSAYGGGFQYGNPSFDTKQLYASLTVNPNITSSATTSSSSSSSSSSSAPNPGSEFWALASQLASSKDQTYVGGSNDGAFSVSDEGVFVESGSGSGSSYTYDELAAIASEPLHSWFVALAKANPDVPPNPPT
jgi:hypothetical protein